MNWYVKVLKNYANFAGRAQRKEYWYFILFNIIFAFVLGFIDGAANLTTASGWGPLGGVYTLAMLVPGIAVGVRRLHDIGKSGWFLLLALIPIIGLILLLFLVRDSQPGANEYGPNPKTN